jgi:hypothetical protein
MSGAGPDRSWLGALAQAPDVQPAQGYGARPATGATEPVAGALVPAFPAHHPGMTGAAGDSPDFAPGAVMPLHRAAADRESRFPLADPAPGVIAPLPDPRDSRPDHDPLAAPRPAAVPAVAGPGNPRRRGTRPPPSLSLDRLFGGQGPR